MAILSEQQLKEVGFKSIGKNVRISDKASIYGAQGIAIGDNVRIDDFVVLSAGAGGIDIGNYIHIAVFSTLIGQIVCDATTNDSTADNDIICCLLLIHFVF